MSIISRIIDEINKITIIILSVIEKKKKILDTEEKIYNINKTNKKQPRYKLLYNLHQKYNKRDKIEKRIDKSDILDENCTFVPKISNIDIMNRTFSNIKKKKKPKGFNDYVNRNRSVLEKKEPAIAHLVT